jgi:hypothetical protein
VLEVGKGMIEESQERFHRPGGGVIAQDNTAGHGAGIGFLNPGLTDEPVMQGLGAFFRPSDLKNLNSHPPWYCMTQGKAWKSWQ